jgi:hypothetical protein
MISMDDGNNGWWVVDSLSDEERETKFVCGVRPYVEDGGGQKVIHPTAGPADQSQSTTRY